MRHIFTSIRKRVAPAHIRVEGGGLLSVQTQLEADALQAYGQLQLLPGGQLEVRETGVVLTGRPAPKLDLYPNPTNDQQVRFTLREEAGPAKELYHYRLLTQQGLAVRRGQCATAEGFTTLTGLPAGTYILELTGPRGQRLTRRVQVAP